MTDGVKFLYDCLPALGSKSGSKPQTSYSDVVSQQATAVPPVSLASNPMEQQPSGGSLVASAVQEALAVQGPHASTISDTEDFLPFNLVLTAATTKSSSAAVARDQQHTASTSGSVDLPWTSDINLTSPLLRLHHEIVTFCRVLEPTSQEAAMRSAAIARVTEVVQAIWPNASVKLFGSFLTGLYLPTSDIDLVVVDSGCTDIHQGLKAIATSLLRKNMASGIQVIGKAKVPIVKFVETGCGINFDMSFDVANGPQAAEYIKSLLDDLTPMKPLVLILKIFLQQREMNEVYQGGIGSYALLVMVAGFLMTHPSRFKRSKGDPGGIELNLGQLLLDFFRLFGQELDSEDVGVSCRNGGKFFNKEDHGFFQAGRPDMISIEDPNDVDNDLGKGSFNYFRCRAAFMLAFRHLIAPSDVHESRLLRIIRLDDILKHRAKLVAARTPAITEHQAAQPRPIGRKRSPAPVAAPAASIPPSAFAPSLPKHPVMNGIAQAAVLSPNPRLHGIMSAPDQPGSEGRDQARSKKQHGRGRERDRSAEPERHSSHHHGRLDGISAGEDRASRDHHNSERSKRHKKDEPSRRRHRERSASPPPRVVAKPSGHSVHSPQMTSPSAQRGPGSLSAVVARMAKSPDSQSGGAQHRSSHQPHARHRSGQHSSGAKHKHFQD